MTRSLFFLSAEPAASAGARRRDARSLMSYPQRASGGRGNPLSELAKQPLACDSIEHGNGRVCLELLDPVIRCHQPVVYEGSTLDPGEKIRAPGHLLRVGLDQCLGNGAEWNAVVQQVGSV